MPTRELRLLHRLCRLHGVEPVYRDVEGKLHAAGPESLLAVLAALGAPVAGPGDVPAALREGRQQYWGRLCEPVAVAWAGRPARIELRLPAGRSAGLLECRLQLENGRRWRWALDPGRLPLTRTATIEGVTFAARQLTLPAGLPWGYHHLHLSLAGRSREVMIISAPARSWDLGPGQATPPNPAALLTPAGQPPALAFQGDDHTVESHRQGTDVFAGNAAPAGAENDRAPCFRLAGRDRGRDRQRERLWGCFLPLYALHSRHSMGAGDLGDLENLVRWTGSLGGGFTGTLPLLAAFLDEPLAPSPYQPVSRLFWNEFYLDLDRLEEIQHCPAARELLNSTAVREEVASLRAASLVDYRRGMALKRRLLELCARSFFTSNPGGQEELQRWLAANPAAREYACFRATGEKLHTTWPHWPTRMRAGCLREGDYDPEAVKYHLYVQWQAHRQLQDVVAEARRSGPGLYLDFPLGVHGEGYDVWRYRQAFATAASSGAPPDTFFRQGQDWGFPPLHPEGVREDGYSYYVACLRQHLRYAGILRLDHVMGLHHLFWIPRGLAAGEGVYVRYHAEEFYALLALESRRHRAILVGEDLGTVPGYVRRAMARHNVYRMYVLAAAYTGPSQPALQPVPAGSLASLNTHDMPPFAAFWRERRNHHDRAALPLFLYNRGCLAVPTTATGDLLRGCLAYLATSPASLLMINLEDLWLATEPQNIPGTVTEHPNWRRKARYSLEEFSRLPGIVPLLEEINRLWVSGAHK